MNKRNHTLICLTLLLVLMLFGEVRAEVSGVCSNCHTMHNSQGGIPMNYNGSDIPNQRLLRGDAVMHRTPPVISSTPYPRFTIQTLRTLQEGISGML